MGFTVVVLEIKMEISFNARPLIVNRKGTVTTGRNDTRPRRLILSHPEKSLRSEPCPFSYNVQNCQYCSLEINRHC